jgi:hypothetical protein
MHFQIKNFSGIIPKISPRLLPENAAVTAKSTELYTGEIRGIKKPTFIRTVGDDAYRAFRAYVKDTVVASPTKGQYLSTWVTFDDPTVNFHRGPTINDEYQRYYWTGVDTKPSVVDGNELLLHDGDLSQCNVYRWGIPNPTTTPATTPPPGVEPNVEVRSYVFTFVNQWGEESGPSFSSEPKSGGDDATWIVTGLQSSFPGGEPYKPLDLVKGIRIYRTLVGSSGVSFRLVDEIAPATTYSDSKSSSEVALNEALDTVLFEPPLGSLQADDNLSGLVQLPNGMFAAFNGTDVHFSEPYKPASFPSSYRVSTGANVIGLGTYHSGLVVCTDSNPKVLSGASPLNMTMIDIDQHEPCLSLASIVSAHDGVYYVSQDGLIRVTEAGAELVTKQFVSRTEWQRLLTPSEIQGAVGGQGYIGLQSASEGFILGPEVGNRGMITIGNLSYIRTVQNDVRTGEVYVIRNGQLFHWNPARSNPLVYEWESKTFETPYPLNFGAFVVKWEKPTIITDIDDLTDYSYWNQEVWDYADTQTWSYEATNYSAVSSLHTYNQFAYNSKTPWTGPKVDTSPPGYPVDKYYPVVNKMPFGGSDLIPPDTVDLAFGVNVTVLAKLKNEPEFREVYSRYVTNENQQRLPAGFKADLWRIKIKSSANLYSIAIAETGRELAKV